MTESEQSEFVSGHGESRSIVGASFDQTEQAAVDPNDMPMIVWLRGDESYLDDFCIDADAAMKALGIKRSRLTQISGKELRVGRLRVDRYTRPVYRVEDIEAYRSWTRATASHLRSSSAVHEAAERLEERSAKLSEEVGVRVQQMVEETKVGMNELRDEVRKHHQNYTEQSHSLLEHQKLEFFRHLDQSYEDLRLRIAEVSSALSPLNQLLQNQSTLSAAIAELGSQLSRSAAQQSSNEDAAVNRSLELAKQIEQCQAGDRDIGKALSLIVQFQRDSIRRFDELKESLQSVRSEVKAEEEETPRPTRKVPFALRRRQARKMV
jgi:hypothetical protein